MVEQLLELIARLRAALAAFDPGCVSAHMAAHVADQMYETAHVCSWVPDQIPGRDPGGAPVEADPPADPYWEVLDRCFEVRIASLQVDPADITPRLASALEEVAQECAAMEKRARRRAEAQPPALGPAEMAVVRAQMAAYARGFDPGPLTGAQAVAVVDHAAATEKMAATVKALAAARAEQCGAFGSGGDVTPAHALARRTGTTVTRAKDALATARRLGDQPHLGEAARAGRVSAEQAAAISDAAAANPAAEKRLVGHATATATSLAELRQRCEEAKAAADDDPDATHKAILAARYARRRNTPDGGAEVTYHSTRDQIARFWAVVQGFADAEFRRARRQGRRDGFDAYAADAMAAMAAAAAGRPPNNPAPAPPDKGTGASLFAPESGDGEERDTDDNHGPRAPVAAKVIVRVDWEALMRGAPVDGDTCDIAGVGPVPVSVVREMMASGDAFLAAVVTRGKDVVNVAHLGRRATAFQRTALEWLQPTCTVAGCDVAAHLEIDHRHDWATTRVTDLKSLDPLCKRHHRQKTVEGWGLVEGTGKRDFVAPDDPRHPRNKGRPPPGEDEP